MSELQRLRDENKRLKKLLSSEKVWKTVIPNRRPATKVYEKRGHAISSLMYRKEYVEKDSPHWEPGMREYEYCYIPDGCDLYKLVDSEWVKVEFTRFFRRRESLTICE